MKIKISESKNLTVEESVQLEVLIGKFSERCPIQPLDLMNLNLRTVASLGGLTITYVLVLFKFKLGDKETDVQTNLLNNATLQYLISALNNTASG